MAEQGLSHCGTSWLCHCSPLHSSNIKVFLDTRDGRDFLVLCFRSGDRIITNFFQLKLQLPPAVWDEKQERYKFGRSYTEYKTVNSDSNCKRKEEQKFISKPPFFVLKKNRFLSSFRLYQQVKRKKKKVSRFDSVFRNSLNDLFFIAKTNRRYLWATKEKKGGWKELQKIVEWEWRRRGKRKKKKKNRTCNFKNDYLNSQTFQRNILLRQLCGNKIWRKWPNRNKKNSRTAEQSLREMEIRWGKMFFWWRVRLTSFLFLLFHPLLCPFSFFFFFCPSFTYA